MSSGLAGEISGLMSRFDLIFVIFIVIIVISLMRIMRQKKINDNSPILTVAAKLVSKHTEDRYSGADDTFGTRSYSAVFEVESGSRLTFDVDAITYVKLSEGDYGSLTFQGTRYIGFTTHHT